MLIPVLATIVRLMWFLIEYTYLWRYRVKPTQDWDRHSAKLWDLANAFELLGMVLALLGIGRIHTSSNVIGPIGLGVMIGGIAIRWVAVYTLGKFFTGLVMIKTNHQLVRTGIYKYLRHPAYTGTLLAHLGLGLAFSNWYTLLISTVPYLLVVSYRMRVEERALASAFGAEYTTYCKTSRRLIPGVY
jgi:protein-S-isoprenylcysteine O-methyltransferase Ste14